MLAAQRVSLYNKSVIGFRGTARPGIPVISNCTNTFLAELSKQYPDDLILLVCDGAAWHRSKTLVCPENIQLLSIPPYTPEMNPIEQIWKQIRSMGFRNEIFHSLADVVDRLCDTICRLTNDIVKSITGRDWIIKCFS